ncbi:ROK family protein [Pseudonocardia sp. TRM90224]|uniref:ROK family protein n=1 Tax=Pseudonocardia sp. TRM90224 TaxID=2812678 RepID=UPI001E64EE38|nr:ROK family protein [Pseudonocardia sp. TRM90224]
MPERQLDETDHYATHPSPKRRALDTWKGGRLTARIGVDIGGTKMLLLASGPDGQLIGERLLKTGPTIAPSRIERHINQFADDLPTPVDAIGIAVPGLVHRDTGQVEMSDVLPQLNGWQPRRLLGEDVTQVLVNDIRAALIHSSRSLRSDATAAIMLAGTAIGMAAMSGGRVVTGVNGWAGEIGSVPMPTPNGIRRLDQIAGGFAIVAAAGMPATQVHAALAAGDVRVTEIVRSAGEAFGLAIATVVNLFNPEVITLAGGTLKYDRYLDAALLVAEQTSLPPLWQACSVRRAEDADHVVALGALLLADRANAGLHIENDAIADSAVAEQQ